MNPRPFFSGANLLAGCRTTADSAAPASAVPAQARPGQLGTNLLTVQNGQSLTGGTAELPLQVPAMIGRLPGVTSVQSTATVSGFNGNGVNAYRTPLVNPINTNGLSVDAARLGLRRRTCSDGIVGGWRATRGRPHGRSGVLHHFRLGPGLGLALGSGTQDPGGRGSDHQEQSREEKRVVEAPQGGSSSRSPPAP
jgi:hypothetical protein